MPIADVVASIKDHLARAPGYSLYRDYDAGIHRYPFATEAFRAKYDWLLEQAKANKCPTVLSNFTDRIAVAAWSGEGAQAADTLTERIGMRQVLNLAVREAWRSGDSFVLVWPNKRGELKPLYHRADRAGFLPSDDDPDAPSLFYKVWIDTPTGHGRLNLYYDDRVERWVTRERIKHDGTDTVQWPEDANGWTEHTNDADGPVIKYGTAGIPAFDGIPWVHLVLDPDEQGGHGRSILQDVIPLQDGLNHTLASMIVSVEEYGAPLRSLLNYSPKTVIDPQTGKPTEEVIRYDETRNKIFGIRGPGPFTQHTPPDSSNLLEVLGWFSSEIANTVGMPVSDIAPDLGNVPSGSALRLLAARRTAAVEDFNQTNTPAVSRLVGLLGVPEAYPMWLDAAPTDEAERLEAAQQKADLGIPLSEVLREMGRDQDDIDRVMAAIAAEQASAARVAVDAFRQGRDPAATLG